MIRITQKSGRPHPTSRISLRVCPGICIITKAIGNITSKLGGKKKVSHARGIQGKENLGRKYNSCIAPEVRDCPVNLA